MRCKELPARRSDGTSSLARFDRESARSAPAGWGWQIWAVAMAVCLLAAGPAAAGTTEDTQLWTTARINHPIGERWALSFWTQGRFDDDISDYASVMLRPALHYEIHPQWKVGIGYNHWNKDAAADEDWAFQEVAFAHRFEKLALGHRARLEQRWIEGIGGAVWRGRYRLHAAHPLGDSAWYVVGANEVFVNLNSKGEGPPGGFDQNRLFGGVGVHLGSHLRVEAGYQWRFQEKRSGPDVSDHIILLNFFLDTRGKPEKRPRAADSHH